MVLAHERAHLKRGDQLWKPLGFLLLTAYWFNPVCWLAYVLFCRDIEAACDEKVVRELGDGCKTAYSRALLQCSVPRRMITACPLAFGETGVKGRIKSVLHYKKPAFWVVLAAVVVSVAVAVCFLTDPKTDTEQPAEDAPASTAADGPAEENSTPPTSGFFSSIQDYAEYYITQVILPEPIEYKVLTDGGFETVTDTVRDAQMVNFKQLASLSGLDPEGDLQLWSYKIAIAPVNADGRTLMLSTDTGLSYIDGQEYLVDNIRYLVTVTYRSETQDYRLLGWTKDTDGTALAVYEQSGRLKDYLRDIYAATHGANNIQGYFYPSFYNGMDGYGRAVHIDAYFSTFPDEAGGWGAYLPTTGWSYDESGLVSSTHLTGSTLEAKLLAGTDVSSRIADYMAQGYDSQLTNRYTVFTLASGAENELVYLFGAADGCYEVHVHWTLGEDRETSSGYNPYLQTRYEGQILKQIAASFTPLDDDDTALKKTMLAQARGNTLFVYRESIDCPYGVDGCTLHTQTSLLCKTADGDERLLVGPAEDRTYWFMHDDGSAGYLRLGFLEQDPAGHSVRFSTGYVDVTVPELTAQAYYSYEDVSLSGPDPEAPEPMQTNSGMPVQPCELTLPNGVYPGLSYETALQKAQRWRGSRVWRGKTPGDNFTVDGVSYYFSPDQEGVLRLDSYAVTTAETAAQEFLRGIKTGDGLHSVLDTIPAADWLPEQLYTQLLYGDDLVSGDRALLEWDASAYHPGRYTLRLKAGQLSASVRFDTDGLVSKIYVSDQ